MERLEWVFLHGFLGDHHDWWTTFQEFKVSDTLRSFDLPFHGQWRLSRKKSFDALVQEVKRKVLNNHRKVILVGYSMGGRLATAIAFELQKEGLLDHLKALVLVSSSMGIEDRGERKERRVQDKGVFPIDTTMELFLEKWYKNQLFNTFRRTPQFSTMLEKRMGNDGKQMRLALESLGPGNHAHWTIKELESLKIPIFYFSGSLDKKYNSLGNELSKAENVYWKSFSGAGHCLHLEQNLKFIFQLENVRAHVSSLGHQAL